MKYVIGVDGGGTKTVCALANENGEVLYITTGKGTNHQICGFEKAISRLEELINRALCKAGLSSHDISGIYLGLSGADFNSDVEKLEHAVRARYPDIKIKVVNDIMLAFATEIHEGWGAVSICGTGHNAAVITPEGKVHGILALKEILGNWGGGRLLSDQAIHYAFRSYQNTGEYTLLEKHLPELCSVSDMDELSNTIYNSNYKYHYRFPIPPLVFQLADDGDKLCRKLIRNMGFEMGGILKGLLKKADLKRDTVPVALGGSLYCCKNSGLLIDGFREGLGDAAPAYDFRILMNPPIMGALILAMNRAGIESDKCTIKNLSDSLKHSSAHIKKGGA